MISYWRATAAREQLQTSISIISADKLFNSLFLLVFNYSNPKTYCNSFPHTHTRGYSLNTYDMVLFCSFLLSTFFSLLEVLCAVCKY